MPYILKDHRVVFDEPIANIAKEIKSVGELNYCITTLIHNYTKNHIMRYGMLNDCLGVLDAVAREYYRKVVAPYEDKKIEENGDIGILLDK